MKEIVLDSVDFNLVNNYMKNLNPIILDYTVAHNPVIPIILSKLFQYKPVYKIFLDESDNMCGFMQGVMISKKFVSMPHFSYGGAVAENSELAILMQQSIKDNFEIRSIKKSSQFGNFQKVTSYIPLIDTKENYFKSLKYNIRRQIRIAGDNNIKVVFGKNELLKDFFDVYTKNMARLGSPSQPHAFFESILNNWCNGNAVIVCSYIDKKPVGACFTLSFGSIIENCWAGTLYEYNKLFVPYLQYWKMIEYSFDQGYQVFSFGRSTHDSGSLAFKKHWNSITVPLYFNMDKEFKGGIKDRDKLISIYRKVTNRNLNMFIGSLVTKYIY